MEGWWVNACAFALIYTSRDLLVHSRGVGNNLARAHIYNEVIHACTYSDIYVI